MSGITVSPSAVDALRNGQAGYMAPSARGWGISTATFTANVAGFSRLVPTRPTTVTAIGFYVSSGGTGNVDVGIYDSTLGTRIASSGSTSGKKSPGLQTVSISASLTAGATYYAAFVNDAGDGALTLASLPGNGGLWGSTAGVADGLSKTSSFPLPTSISSPSTTGTPVILLVIGN